MDSINIRIISNSKEMPDMVCGDFFHSVEFFKILENTPQQNPYMVVAETTSGVVAHMLAVIRRRGALLPPYLYTHGRIYGEGEYSDNYDQEQLFQLMLNAITTKFKRTFCLYAEFSNLRSKMFGYRIFRENGYFPVSWQEVHNSLHSLPPKERLSKNVIHLIDRAINLGAVTREVCNDTELHELYKLTHNYYRTKIRRFIPVEKQFRELHLCQHAKLFITLFHGKIIGSCTCIYSGGNAYLWFLASKRKTYHKLRPDLLTVWHAINHAYSNNYAHFFFLDGGLPMKRNSLRDFILKFGGKTVTKYRWFRFSFPFFNSCFSKFFSD